MGRTVLLQENDVVIKLDLDDCVELASALCQKTKGPKDLVLHSITVARHSDGRLLIIGEEKSETAQDQCGGVVLPGSAESERIKPTIHDVAASYGVPYEFAEQCYEDYASHPAKDARLERLD